MAFEDFELFSDDKERENRASAQKDLAENRSDPERQSQGGEFAENTDSVSYAPSVDEYIPDADTSSDVSSIEEAAVPAVNEKYYVDLGEQNAEEFNQEFKEQPAPLEPGVESDIEYDLDGDGIADMRTMNIIDDVDGDGVMERYYIEMTDEDGDGYYDILQMATDYDADRHFELVEVYAIDYVNEEFVLLDQIDISDENRNTLYFEMENLNPENADNMELVGDPEESVEYWEFQGATNRCAVCSQMFVIEELTGSDLNLDEVAAFAVENGWFSEEYGTSLADCNKLLDAFGVENHMETNASIDEIEAALDNGQKVIVAVDADEYWMGESDELYMPADGANHAVEVIGIDRTDPENPKVILNDSGIPNGKGIMVPMDVFLDAWEDSDNLAIFAG